LIRHFLAQEQIINDQQVGFREKLVDLFCPIELRRLEKILEEGMGGGPV
jgi:hypothetical protein